jgi:3-hydroxybutyrate dehydrogenase
MSPIVRGALPVMRARGWGRTVNVSSIYGVRGAASRAAYVATKTGLIGLTRAVALETAGEGTTCNAICPGTRGRPFASRPWRRWKATAG